MKSNKELQEEIKVAKAIRSINDESTNRNEERKRLENELREISKKKNKYKESISKISNKVRQGVRTGSKHVGGYIRKQQKHIKENQGYWNVDNMYSLSSFQPKKVIPKKKIKKLRPRTRVVYRNYPPPYYGRPIARTSTRVKHRRKNKVKSKPAVVRQADPYSMFNTYK